MANPLESARQGRPASTEKPPIETIGAAAAEVTRLYGVLSAQAVPVDGAYIHNLFAGEQGKTWDILHVGIFGKEVPLFPSVIKHNGRLKLGAAMTFRNGIKSDYWLQEGMDFEPDAVEDRAVLGANVGWTRDGKIHVPGALRLREERVSHDPGSEFVVIEDKVLKTGYTDFSSSYNARVGHIEPSTIHLSGKYTLMTDVPPALLRVIKGIQEFEDK